MNFQLFLAVIVAATIVMASYQYLKWSVIVSLGGLFIVSATVALFLHIQNDSITWSIPVGDGLFRRGESISILGEYGWLAWIGLVTGIALMIAGIVQKMRMPKQQPDTQGDETPPTEQQKITQALEEEIAELQGGLGDPVKVGKREGLNPGGAIPDTNATEPQGYEDTARRGYEALGNKFVSTTVHRLMGEITAALGQLKKLKPTLASGYYAVKATAHYRTNAKTPVPAAIAKLKVQVAATTKQENDFHEKVNIANGAPLDWPKPTSDAVLCGLGLVFMAIEFGVSWYFLQGDLGTTDAIIIALYAMTVIFVLAVVLAGLYRFTRPPLPVLLRALTCFGWGAFLGLLLLGFGLLLEYRDTTEQLQSGQFGGAFDAIVGGYISLLTDLGNLTLFLINMIAFGIFYWKFLHWCERFYGCRAVVDNAEKATREFYELTENNTASIEDALDVAGNESERNRQDAEQAAENIGAKKNILKDIKDTLTPLFVLKLHSAFDKDVRDYRESNNTNRNVLVDPPPDYFKQSAAICGPDAYFAGDHGIDKFLSGHESDITQAGADSQKVGEAATTWGNESAELKMQWAGEFADILAGKKKQ